MGCRRSDVPGRPGTQSVSGSTCPLLVDRNHSWTIHGPLPYSPPPGLNESSCAHVSHQGPIESTPAHRGHGPTPNCWARRGTEETGGHPGEDGFPDGVGYGGPDIDTGGTDTHLRDDGRSARESGETSKDTKDVEKKRVRSPGVETKSPGEAREDQSMATRGPAPPWPGHRRRNPLGRASTGDRGVGTDCTGVNRRQTVTHLPSFPDPSGPSPTTLVDSCAVRTGTVTVVGGGHLCGWDYR